MINLEERQKQLTEYAESLKGKTLDELEKIESELIAEADENDQTVSKLEFDLPKDNYKVVAEGIRMLLNKQTVQWQYTLGLVGLYDFRNPSKSVDENSYFWLYQCPFLQFYYLDIVCLFLLIIFGFQLRN